METVLKGTGISIAVLGFIGTIYLVIETTANKGVVFISSLVATYLLSLIFIALGSIIKNQYAADSNSASNIEELEKKITSLK